MLDGTRPRIDREKKTLGAMVAIYCRGLHGAAKGRSGGLCDDCRVLLDYAQRRLDACPFGESKTTCAKCPIHCYSPKMKEKARAVMRYAGPKMLLRHPILALRHWLDSRAFRDGADQ